MKKVTGFLRQLVPKTWGGGGLKPDLEKRRARAVPPVASGTDASEARQRMCDLSLSISRNRKWQWKTPKNAVNVPPLLWLWVRSPSRFAGGALVVLLVMLIVSRPPAERDPFPVGRLWSCLPKEMSLCVSLCVCVCACVSVCIYSVQSQCVTKALVMLRTCVCVWLCVSGRISTDLHAPAVVRRPALPVLPTLRGKKESRAMFHLNSVTYRLFSFFVLSPALILLAKQNLWEERETPFTCLCPRWITSYGFLGKQMTVWLRLEK